MEAGGTLCPVPAACPPSEQLPVASELAVAASSDVMAGDDRTVAGEGVASTSTITPALDVLQSIDGNAGERGTPSRTSRPRL